ncbi:MAG: hypothetical protein CMJ48_00180 [Planctomycetaceae bacterium]|nr:hypothetical protein [Planctomycetaceae bacterium]
MFQKMTLRTKLISSFLAVGLVPLIAVSYLSQQKAENALSDQAFAQLEAVRGIKKAQIEKYFGEREGDMGVLVETVGTLRQEAMNKLIAVREIKKNQIESYFQTINDQMLTFSENRMVVDAMQEFRTQFRTARKENNVDAQQLADWKEQLKAYYTDQFGKEYASQNPGTASKALDYLAQLDDDSLVLQHRYISGNTHPLGSKHQLDRADDPSKYSELHGKYHPVIRNYLEKFGYYDIFLVDLETGDIVYSVFKELDYSTSLLDGPYAKTNFGDAFRKAKAAESADSIVLVDYEQYTPSYEAPASFIASPIYDGDEKVGVAIFQMPLDRINSIMGERSGLGETGETYLVGPDDLMRSDSYLDPKNHSVQASFRRPETGAVHSDATVAALKGESGTKVIIDYNGNPVLSAYAPVHVGSLTWAIASEIDVAEAFAPKVDGAEKDYFTQYKEQYGYYDLFLINPDGYIFYTVEQEPDYHTNIITGEYKDSGLGHLVSQVAVDHKFSFADFAPYAPSAGAPAAFIAQPVVHDGKVDCIVALQIPLDAINNVMLQRDGMGETGETYLVGSDKLMRSDSYLDTVRVAETGDPAEYSVVASFAGNHKVETVAVDEALAGKTGSQIVIDYNGNPVLSAYGPLEIWGQTWAILAEIDEAEAFAATTSLTRFLQATAVIALAAIACLALFLTRPIVAQLKRATLAGQRVAQGDLDTAIADGSNDEIGQLVSGFAEVVGTLNTEIGELVDSAKQGDLEARADQNRFEGCYKELIAGINDMLNAICLPVTGATRLMEKVASGDLTERMSEECEGDLERLKTSINTAVDNLDTTISHVAVT